MNDLTIGIVEIPEFEEFPKIPRLSRDCVPILYEGPFSTSAIGDVLAMLATNGSAAAPGFMKPEGVVIYHVQGRLYFKKTIEKDELPKGMASNE